MSRRASLLVVTTASLLLVSLGVRGILAGDDEGVVRISGQSAPQASNDAPAPDGAPAEALPPQFFPAPRPDAINNVAPPFPAEVYSRDFGQPPRRQQQFGPRYLLDKRINGNIGTTTGDTNIGVLWPFLFDANGLLFADVRGFVSDDGEGGGGNIGLGYRSYSPEYDRIFGIAAGFDYDGGHQRDFQQLFFSFESLGRWIDVRANGYLPVGTTRRLVASTLTGEMFFTGNQLMQRRQNLVESAFYGGEFEIGGPLPLLGRYGVKGYIGGYFMDSDSDRSALGIQGRIEAQVTDDFRAAVSLSGDDTFGTNVWVNLILGLPDGRPSQWFRPLRVRDRMTARIERSYRVRTRLHTVVDSVPVMMGSGSGGSAPLSGSDPVLFAFIDPQASGNNAGTFEDPFITLADYMSLSESQRAQFDIILVNAGPESNPTAGLDTGIELLDNQRLLSTAILPTELLLDPTLVLPPVGITNRFPILTNRNGGAVIVLKGNNTEVAGFIIDGSTPAGIPNADGIVGSNIQGFNIHSNVFRNYRYAVNLRNVTSQFDANGVAVAGTRGLFRSNILAGTAGVSISGFRVENDTPGTLDLYIGALPFVNAVGNIATGNDQAAFEVIARNGAVINAHIEGNVTTSEDTNGNGVLDNEDINGNGILDISEDFNEDINGNGILDPGEDINGDGILYTGNGNGVLDPAEDADGDGVLDTEDVNGNGILDTEDVNGNGILDPGEDFNEDINGNGVLDPGEDINGDGFLNRGNGNGRLDLGEDANEDLNGNGILDPGEDVNGDGFLNQGNGNGILDTEDLNGNGRLDPSEDRNGNGILDLGEDFNEDTNGNGILDPGEDINGDGFLNRGNGNGVLDNEDRNGNGVLDGGNGIGLALTATNGGQISGTVINNVFSFNRGDDANLNGVLDASEMANDIGANGMLDRGVGILITASNSSVIDLFSATEDLNGNGRLDASEDRNGNGVLDPSEDTNSNGVLDPGEDLNGNGILDPGEDRDGDGVLDPPEDRNGNGILDGPEDINRNGILDGNEDTNGNGVLDGGRILADNRITNNTGDGIRVDSTGNSIVKLRMVRNVVGDPTEVESGNGGRGLRVNADSGVVLADIGFILNEDVNGDGVLNTEDANRNGVLDPGEDQNGNGVLDLGEDFDEDLNGNGVLDPGEDVNGDGFLNRGNGNGRLDAANPNDANMFFGNAEGAIAFDLTGTAISNINIVNNLIQGEALMSGSVFRSGFDTNALPADDNSSVGPVNLGFEINFFGQLFSQAFVNNDGNLSFGSALDDFMPGDLLSQGVAAIAPFFADVDTRQGNVVTYGTGTVDGRPAFGVNWIGVRHNDADPALGPDAGRPENSFQLVLIDRSDIKPGDFDFEFNYGSIQWEAGQADGANALGLGGAAARVGYTDGMNVAFELPGSGVNGALLDNGPINTSLINNSINSDILGRYVFQARNGTVVRPSVDTRPPIGAPGVLLNLADSARLQGGALISGNQFIRNSGAGLKATSAQDAVIENLVVRNNTFRSNGANSMEGGIYLQTQNAAAAEINALLRNNTFDANAGNGITVIADGGTIELSELTLNTIQRSSESGVALTAENSGTITTRFGFNTITDNLGHGMFAMAGDSGRITFLSWNNNRVSGNTEYGALFQTATAGTITVQPTEDTNLNGRLDAGEDVNGNGVLDTGLAQNDLSDNGLESLRVAANTGAVALGTVDNNNFNRTTGTSGSVLLEGTDAAISGQFTRNTFVGVAGAGAGIGFRVTAFGSGPDEDTNGNGVLDAGEDLNGNGRLDRGIEIVLGKDDPDSDTSFRFGNVFDQNTDAAIDIQLTGDIDHPLTSQLEIRRNLITRTEAGTLSGFNGDAIRLKVDGGRRTVPLTNEPAKHALLRPSTIADNLIGDLDDSTLANAGNGIFIHLAGYSNAQDLNISGNVIANAGGILDPMNPPADPADGIRILREDNAALTALANEDDNDNGILDPTEDHNGNGVLDFSDAQPRAVTISANVIQDAVGHGISITALNGREFPDHATLSQLDFHVGQTTDVMGNVIEAGNTIRGSGGDGIRLISGADAILRVDIVGNLIENNTGDGIFSDIILVDPSIPNPNVTSPPIPLADLPQNPSGDDPVVTGIWIGNVIRGNMGNGIQLAGSVGTSMQPLLIGDGTARGRNIIGGFADDGVTQAGNMGDGIRIAEDMLVDAGGNPVFSRFTSFVVIDGNTIRFNQGSGVDTEVRAFQAVDLMMTRNDIIENVLDGVELLSTGVDDPNNPANNFFAGDPFAPVTDRVGLRLVATNNNISLNQGRGIDLLNRANSRMDVAIEQSQISSNGLEGIYAVNTSSTTQAQDVPSLNALAADGDVFRRPEMHLRIRNNRIEGNGNEVEDQNIGGLVLRVGTSDSESGSVVAGLGIGGVIAEVTNNSFEGNFGADVYIESFTSTVDPPTGFPRVEDPLARLDLAFAGNSGNSIDVTNFGGFYDNADAAKSPQPLPDDRRRNAQRLNGVNPASPTTVIEGEVIGLHTSSVQQRFTMTNPPVPIFPPTLTSFEGLAGTLDTRPSIYNGLLLRFRTGVNAGVERQVFSYSGDPGMGAVNQPQNAFTLANPLLGVPSEGDSFEIELSRGNIFDAVGVLGPLPDPAVTNLAGAQLTFITGNLAGQSRTITNHTGPANTTNPFMIPGSEATFEFLTPFDVTNPNFDPNNPGTQGEIFGPFQGDRFQILVGFQPGFGSSTFRVETDYANNNFDILASDFTDLFPLGDPLQGELPFGWDITLPQGTVNGVLNGIFGP